MNSSENNIKNIKKNGGHFSGWLMVKSVETGVTNMSKQYLNITFQDVTGTLDARKWEVYPSDLAILIPGRVVDVEGDIFSYKGQMQMKVLTINDVDQQNVIMEDFTQSSPLPLDFMKAELAADIKKIKNDDVRRIVDYLVKSHYEQYTTYPAAMSFHHAYFGGLLFHSLSICRMAEKVADNYTFLNRDYLIAGSLLHDIGKTIELSGNVSTSYTNEGKLLGHINIGATLIDEAAEQLNIKGEVPLVLEHIILSHHGVPEFGSAVLPRIAEAYVVHELDDLDSRLNMLGDSLATIDGGEFSLKLPGFDGRTFYKIKGTK